MISPLQKRVRRYHMSSRFSASIVAAGLSAALLAGCGHGGGSSQPVVPGSGGGSGTLSVGSAPATFSFTFPNPTTSAKARATQGTRAPKYLSSATKSITVQVTDTKNAGSSTDIFANVPAALKAVQSVNFANLTQNPNTPGQCGPDPNNANNIKCTAVFQMPIGINSTTIASWDANGGTGNKLSQQIASITIVQGATNSPAVSLDANAGTLTLTGSGACAVGTVGTVFGSVGTTPVTFSASFTDLDGKTIVAPGLPLIEVMGNDSAFHSDSGTINGTGGTVAFTVNQSAQTITLTPSTAPITNVAVNAKGVPPGTDGLSFNTPHSFTFSSGTAPPSHNFLAAVEQTGVASGRVDFYNVALGGSGGADTISAFSPATLAVTNSTNQNQPDVDNPLELTWDTNGDLLIANGGGSVAGDNGNLACVPVGAISTGANTSTTVTADVDDPTGMAYDPRDGSVALADGPASSPEQLAEFLLTGDYTAAPATRDITDAGFGSLGDGVVDLPTLAAGSYAIALETGAEADTSHGGTANTSKIAIKTPTGSESDITTPTTGNFCGQGAPGPSPIGPCTTPTAFAVDVPWGIGWDAQNSQLVISNDSTWHRLVSFYTISPVAQVAVINTGGRNNILAVSPDGHVAVDTLSAIGTGDPTIRIYDNSAARNLVGTPIPFDTYDNATDCGAGGNAGMVYGDSGSITVNALVWLSNTKLLVALQADRTGTADAQNGIYVFDISSLVAPAGVDEINCNPLPASPKQTGFVHFTNKPLGAAFKP
jgi:hypothetical protein